jgi:hypothetical protein
MRVICAWQVTVFARCLLFLHVWRCGGKTRNFCKYNSLLEVYRSPSTLPHNHTSPRARRESETTGRNTKHAWSPCRPNHRVTIHIRCESSDDSSSKSADTSPFPVETLGHFPQSRCDKIAKTLPAELKAMSLDHAGISKTTNSATN